MDSNMIKDIINELSNLENVNKQEFYITCVQQRLEESLNSYYSELVSASNYLKNRKMPSLIRRL